MTKYIFVTGGVVSSIGKGITTASLGRLLRNRGFTVAPMKLDPYNDDLVKRAEANEAKLKERNRVALANVAVSAPKGADAELGEFA